MLNLAYKLGEALAVAESSRPEDSPDVRALLAKILTIKEPKEIRSSQAGARSGTDVTTNVSWNAKRDFSTPVG